jgi:hypothetical protein
MAKAVCGADPLSVTECGDVAALSVIVIAAEALPAATGVNVTLIAQDAPAETEAPQLFVSAKLPAFAPVIEIARLPRVAVPVLPNVTV